MVAPQRQPQVEGGARALHAPHRDPAAVRDRHVLHDGQPEPGAAGGPRAGRVDAVEPLEDPGQVPLGDADALIGHADLDPAVPWLFHAHHDPGTLRAVHDGVLQQVPYRGHQKVFLTEDAEPADADGRERDAARVGLHPAAVERLGPGSEPGSAPWIRDSVIRSWTRKVSRDASCRIRPANRRTASASSAASSIVSASRASAPTGVLSSWLTLATKSRRTSSTRCRSVWSSARTRTSPPPPTVPESGATRTAKVVVRPPKRGTGTSNSASRISPSRRTCRARAASSLTMSRSPLTIPKVRAAALARSTRSSLSTTTAEDESTERTDAIPGGSLAGCCAVRSRVLLGCLTPFPARALIAMLRPRPAKTCAASTAHTSVTSPYSHI